MEPEQHGDVIARRDGVEARVLHGSEGVGDALGLLDAAEAVAEVPLVDEAERERLHALEEGREERSPHHHSVLARRDGRAVGYAGIVLPTDPAGAATGDLAVARDRPPCGPVLTALLSGMEELGRRHDAGRLRIWIRHAASEDVVCAADQGYGVGRRLGVLGRRLPEPPDVPAPPAGVELRRYRPDEDDGAVVEILARAYAGTPDAGWDRQQFQERRSYAWFDPEDLLVAEGAGGALLGLHWTKRRNATTGEVYNLAVGPDAQGCGLGAVLLLAGLAHLHERGIRDVLLWVDLANERAVRLYTSHGFATRWEDLALTREIR